MMSFAHTRRSPVCRRRGSHGITLVEAAFALPVFMGFLMALVDLGGAVLQTSQASSAAADGARAGIVVADLTGAETSGVAHERIVAAVKGRLVGAPADNVDVTITCLDASGVTYTCGNEGTERDRARIRVHVSWSWEPVSFVGHGLPITNITASATMGLVALPTGLPTTPSP